MYKVESSLAVLKAPVPSACSAGPWHGSACDAAISGQDEILVSVHASGTDWPPKPSEGIQIWWFVRTALTGLNGGSWTRKSRSDFLVVGILQARLKKTGWNQNPNGAYSEHAKLYISTFKAWLSFEEDLVYCVCSLILSNWSQRSQKICAWGIKIGGSVWPQFFSGPCLCIWHISPPPHCTVHIPSIWPPTVSSFIP